MTVLADLSKLWTLLRDDPGPPLVILIVAASLLAMMRWGQHYCPSLVAFLRLNDLEVRWPYLPIVLLVAAVVAFFWLAPIAWQKYQKRRVFRSQRYRDAHDRMMREIGGSSDDE